MPIRNIDVAIGRDHDRANCSQIVRTIARHSRFAQSHQHSAIGAKLDQIRALTVPRNLVTCPHIAVTIHVETVRDSEQAGAERFLKCA
jgi:hypothetical protein